MLRSVTLSALLIFFGFILLSGVAPARAQSTSGVGLAPSLIETSADPGEVLTRSLEISNLSQREQTYYLFTRDITGVHGGGSPIFADEGAAKTGYELTEWITLDQTELTLPPGGKENVDVTIAVPENATPGSHFGGIFVTLEPPRLRQIGASVGYQVANIVSIRISGDVVENAQIRSLSTNRPVYGDVNVEFTARVENKGNTLIRPVGPLEVYNMFGEKVTQFQFNEQQNGVFPNTIRDFTVTWDDEGFAFGRYQAILTMVYGEQGRAQSSMTSSISFWILPMKIIKPSLIALAIILVGAYLGVRLYIRRTVRTVTGGRRLVRRQQRGPSTLLLVAIVMLVVTSLFLLVLLVLFA